MSIDNPASSALTQEQKIDDRPLLVPNLEIVAEILLADVDLGTGQLSTPAAAWVLDGLDPAAPAGDRAA